LIRLPRETDKTMKVVVHFSLLFCGSGRVNWSRRLLPPPGHCHQPYLDLLFTIYINIGLQDDSVKLHG
jgi:hypothetical protein